MGDDIIKDSTLAGYKTSYPLHPYFLLKIQTDGSMPLAAVLEAAASQLIATLSAELLQWGAWLDGARDQRIAGTQSDPQNSNGVMSCGTICEEEAGPRPDESWSIGIVAAAWD
ncbi:hypothetical protein B0H14DRAFT_3430750 [Mycena olivaceomarginata]|nr:hypothetical protein B0H14DRAFT_3430750 [Mycena olivaceomarginata]